MKLGFSLTQRQELSLAQQLVLKQTHELSLQIQLLRELRGDEYKPTAVCAKCGRKLSLVEILKGFRDDPQDYTTECTGCHNRFQPQLVCLTPSGSMELPFYCSSQVLAQLNGKENLTLEELERTHGAIYHAVIFHHGTLKRAFQKVGLTYAHNEQLDWQEKIRPFLGRLPDTVIAEYTPVSSGVIQRFRQKQNIPAYDPKTSLAEALENEG